MFDLNAAIFAEPEQHFSSRAFIGPSLRGPHGKKALVKIIEAVNAGQLSSWIKEGGARHWRRHIRCEFLRRSRPAVDFQSDEAEQQLSFCDNYSPILRVSLVSHRKYQVSSPASRPFYSSIHSLDQLSSSALSSLFPLLSSSFSDSSTFSTQVYFFDCRPAWWRHSSTNELAGLTSLIALLGDSSMSGLCAEKTRMFVLAYVLLVSRTSGLFVQAIARERSVTTNEPL